MPDVGAREVQAVSLEILPPSAGGPPASGVALMFDFEACWTIEIEPQGDTFKHSGAGLRLVLRPALAGSRRRHRAARRNLTAYRLVLVPTLPTVTTDDIERLRACPGTVVLGIAHGQQDVPFKIPPQLPPGPLQDVLPVKVVRVESLRPGFLDSVRWNGQSYPSDAVKEWLETLLLAEAEFGDGRPALVRADRLCYLGFWPSEDFPVAWLEDECQKLAIDTVRVPADLRLRRQHGIQYAFNYGSTPRRSRSGDAEFRPGRVGRAGLWTECVAKQADGVLASMKAGLLGGATE